MQKINSPYETFLNMHIVEKKEGYCKVGLPYRKELTNPHGNFHGGVIPGIIDTAAVQGLLTIFPKGPFLTVDMQVRFKSPSNSSEIFAESRPKHLKGKFFVSDIKVLDKDNKLIAEAQVKSFLPEYNIEKIN